MECSCGWGFKKVPTVKHVYHKSSLKSNSSRNNCFLTPGRVGISTYLQSLPKYALKTNLDNIIAVRTLLLL